MLHTMIHRISLQLRNQWY